MTKDLGLAVDLNFDEFITRQAAFLQVNLDSSPLLKRKKGLHSFLQRPKLRAGSSMQSEPIHQTRSEWSESGVV